MSDLPHYALTRRRTRRLSRRLAIMVIAVGTLHSAAAFSAPAETGAGLEGLEMDVMNPRETGTTAANRIALPLPRSNAALHEQSDLIDLATPERSAEPMLDALRATEPEAVPTIETPEPAGHE